MNQGIYFIKNLINDKLYIGSSINIKRRIHEHKGMLRYGIHHSKHLQNAWNKYKITDFEFGILEYIEDDNILRKKEKELILQYRSNEQEFGYNDSLPDENSLGIGQHSNETKELLRRLYFKSKNNIFIEEDYQKWLLRNKPSYIRKTPYKNKEDYIKSNIVGVVVLNLQGEFISNYTSITEAANNLKLSKNHIEECISNRVINKKTGSKKRSYGGYMFIRESKYDPNKTYSYKQNRGHKINCFNSSNEFIKEYSSIKEAAQELNIPYNRIYENILGYSKLCKKEYKFEYSTKILD